MKFFSVDLFFLLCPFVLIRIVFVYSSLPRPKKNANKGDATSAAASFVSVVSSDITSSGEDRDHDDAFFNQGGDKLTLSLGGTANNNDSSTLHLMKKNNEAAASPSVAATPSVGGSLVMTACESVLDSSAVTVTHLVKEPKGILKDSSSSKKEPKSILKEPKKDSLVLSMNNNNNKETPTKNNLFNSMSSSTPSPTKEGKKMSPTSKSPMLPPKANGVKAVPPPVLPTSEDIFTANPFNPFASSLLTETTNPFTPQPNPFFTSNTTTSPSNTKNVSPPYSPKEDRPSTPKSLTSLDSAHGGSIASSATPENSPVPPNDMKVILFFIQSHSLKIYVGIAA